MMTESQHGTSSTDAEDVYSQRLLGPNAEPKAGAGAVVAVHATRRSRRTSSAAWISRTAVNLCVDVSLLLNFLTLGWVSVVLRFIFPRGTSAQGWTLWGASYDDLCSFQFVVTCLFALTVLVHVMLHWSWVCGVVANRVSRWKGRTVRLDDGGQTLYGVGLLILLVNLIGLCIAAAALAIRAPAL